MKTHKFYKKINIMIVNISGRYWEIWNKIPYLHHAQELIQPLHILGIGTLAT